MYNVDQWRRLLDDSSETWESVRIEADELIDAGEHVVVTQASSNRGRDGIEVTSLTTWVWTFRDGKGVRLCYYQDKAKALEAVGLSE